MIEGIPAAIFYNMDETGYSDWADAHEIMALLPHADGGTSIHIPVERQSQRATLVRAIAGDGSAVRPMVIVDHVTVEADIRYFPEKVDICSQPNGYMTSSRFELEADRIFFQHVEQARQSLGKYQGPAVLMVDGMALTRPRRSLRKQLTATILQHFGFYISAINASR
jgi:hypothetical protein